MAKATDYRAMSIDELRQREADLRKELFNLRFRKVTGEIENPMRIRIVRKDIARLLTVVREKSQTRE